MEDKLPTLGDGLSQPPDTESPRKAISTSSRPFDRRIPSRAVHLASADSASHSPEISSDNTQQSPPALEMESTDKFSRAANNSKLGVETKNRRAQGDNRDDDFEDVDDEALNPANYPDEQSEEEEEDFEEDEDEETITAYINLGGKREDDDDEAGEGEEAIESVEREEEAGHDHETRDQNEGTEKDKIGSEGSEGHGEQSGEEKDEDRFVRSMSPSPEPSPVKG